MKEFADIGGFLRFMAGMPVRVDTAAHLGLTAAGQIIQQEAHDAIGHYQPAAGPFRAWEELADSTKHERLELGWTENDPLKRSGELQDHVELAIGRGEVVIGVPHEMVGDGSEANPVRDIGSIAVDMEMGTRRVPPRSFLGASAVRKGHEAVDAAAGAVVAALAGHDPKHVASAIEGIAANGLSDIPF